MTIIHYSNKHIWHNKVKEEKDCNLKGWSQTMITFLPPLRSMLLPLHPLQPELHRKQCVRVYWCVSSDIRPVIILSHAKNQTCTLSFLQNCFWHKKLIVSFFLSYLFSIKVNTHICFSPFSLIVCSYDSCEELLEIWNYLT